jgi:predicted O-linked N-acetylglucosamine transferase (SPINDLY family)
MKIKRKQKKAPENILHLAIKYHQTGNLEQAELLCRRILTQQPDNADALLMLGVINSQLGNHDSGILYIKKALKINPNNVGAHYNLGNAFRRKGQFDDAIHSYQKALQLDPNLADLYYNLGCVFYEKGELDDAVTSFQKALQLNPKLFDALCNLGNIYYRKRQLDQAIIYYHKALQFNPNLADIYNNLGTILQEKGQFDEAIIYYHKALQINPDFFDVCYKIGTSLHSKGQIDDAIIYYKKTLRLHPNFPNACTNLGAALLTKGQLEEALMYCQEAIHHKPDLATAHVNLGLVFLSKGKCDEAEKYFRHAMNVQPDNFIAFQNLLFTMIYNSGYDAQAIFSEHANFARQFAEPLSSIFSPHTNERTLNRRLRIGYVSPNFRKHSVAYFIEPVISRHNRKDFEVFCYSTVPMYDVVTARLQGYADHWRSLVGKTDEEASELIRTDGIDILVDLAGHTSDRILLFARKPAPVQVNWIGYPATTGLSTIDYKLVDDYTDPPGMTDQFYTEKLMWLPESFLCYLPERDSPQVGSLPALTAGHITFASFNNFAKVSPEVIEVWTKILKIVPSCRLIMKAISLTDRSTCNHLLDLFAEQGIAPEKIELLSFEASTKEHLGLYNRVDIALDTFPYTGTTTTCEALWMGVPVVTLAGNTHVSRVGTSLLSNIGLPELIATTPDEYVAIAVNLADDLKKLRSLRENLRDTMSHSPLTDAKKFIISLEKCYRSIWEQWCNSVASA